MTLLNYAYHANPSSHHDILAKLKTFAEAQGWTSDYYYNESIQWGATGSSPPYGWISGSESALGLYSTYGSSSRDNIVRFRCEASGSDPQHEWFWSNGIKPGTSRTPDGTSSAHPCQQNVYTSVYNGKSSMSPGTMSAVWFFGDDEKIIIIYAVDSSFILTIFFGIPELYDQSDPGYLLTTTSHIQGVPDYYWYNAWTQGTVYTFAWERWAASTYTNRWDVEYDNDLGGVHSNLSADYTATGSVGYFNNSIRTISMNSWTGKRTMIRPIVFRKRQTDDVWYPMGQWPLFYLPISGLSIGDTVTYGAEEYMTFPCIFNTRSYGVAFRIA